jgi:hypothetical protein
VTDEDAVAVHDVAEQTIYMAGGHVEVAVEQFGLSWFDDWTAILPETGELVDVVLTSKDDLPTLLGWLKGKDGRFRILYGDACCGPVKKDPKCEAVEDDPNAKSMATVYFDVDQCLRGASGSRCSPSRGRFAK